jgi:uncharacterized protein (TIGR02001 family)
MSPYCRDEYQQTIGRSWPARLVARFALIGAGMMAAQAAHGQASASMILASEYSVRGVSLSDGRLAPQLSVAYDGEQGWYAGAFAAPRVSLAQRSDVTELIVYGGFARRLASGLTWEAGMSSASFQHAAEYNYREFYAGVAADRVSARIYLAPAYYGYGGRIVYAELNGFYPLGERFKLLGHAGTLHGLRGPAATARDRVDLRLAIGMDTGAWNIQLAWLSTVSVGSGVPHGQLRIPRALALSASYSF